MITGKLSGLWTKPPLAQVNRQILIARVVGAQKEYQGRRQLLVFGVGISTPAHAAKAAAVGDGVIVGTAIVRRVLEAATPEDAAASLSHAVSEFAEAMQR